MEQTIEIGGRIAVQARGNRLGTMATPSISSTMLRQPGERREPVLRIKDRPGEAYCNSVGGGQPGARCEASNESAAPTTANRRKHEHVHVLFFWLAAAVFAKVLPSPSDVALDMTAQVEIGGRIAVQARGNRLGTMATPSISSTMLRLLNTASLL